MKIPFSRTISTIRPAVISKKACDHVLISEHEVCGANNLTILCCSHEGVNSAIDLCANMISKHNTGCLGNGVLKGLPGPDRGLEYICCCSLRGKGKRYPLFFAYCLLPLWILNMRTNKDFAPSKCIRNLSNCFCRNNNNHNPCSLICIHNLATMQIGKEQSRAEAQLCKGGHVQRQLRKSHQVLSRLHHTSTPQIRSYPQIRSCH